MANTWTTNPVSIDTAEDKDIEFDIAYMEWHPNAANDDIDVEDDSSGTLFKRRASTEAPNSESAGIVSLQFTPPRHVSGIYVKTIDDGMLYIHKPELI